MFEENIVWIVTKENEVHEYVKRQAEFIFHQTMKLEENIKSVTLFNESAIILTQNKLLFYFLRIDSAF